MSKYPIDKAFSSIPSVKVTGSRFRLRLLSFAVGLTRLFYRWGGQVDIKHHRVVASDGYEMEVIQVSPIAAAENGPALMYYHGGGFFLTYGAGHLKSIKRYALKANCTVFFVVYRRSLDFAFPTPFNDCFDALEWLSNNATSLKIDRDRIAVGGDSAGGCLAAAVAQKALDSDNAGFSNIGIVGQLLIYPVIDFETKTESARQFTDTPVWTSGANKVMWRLYLRQAKRDSVADSQSAKIPEYASPIHRDSFAGLPPAYIEAAEFDPLRDEASDYAEQLSAAGVGVHFEFVEAAVHGYDMVNTDISRRYQSRRVEALQRFFT